MWPVLVKLSDEVSVNPECVSSVVTNHEYDRVCVLMNGGGEYLFGLDYGRSIWETADRITKLINGDING